MRPFFVLLLFFSTATYAQVDSFDLWSDIKVCIDKPINWLNKKPTIVCLFALPNGNTIQQTMGKKMQDGDDWHYDIQHVKAQTSFIRQEIPKQNFVVVYLANTYKSWPLWKQKHADYKTLISKLVDSLTALFPGKRKVYLNGHSGGGSFIFGYLEGVEQIPVTIQRISFIDSNYGYDSSYYPKFWRWLKADKRNTLTVFAYNDSVALYNNKPIVSKKGGTWYRSHLMLKQLSDNYTFSCSGPDSLLTWQSSNQQVSFVLKENPERKILHTQQVELNGFIHSVLLRTNKNEIHYRYFGSRAYVDLID